MEIFEDELLSYVKKELSKTNPDLDIDSITQKTDLSNLEIESIIIIALISKIETDFKISISLSSLEKNNFIISVKSIFESIIDGRT